MPKLWIRIQGHLVTVWMPRKDLQTLQDFAQEHDARNSFVKMMRRIFVTEALIMHHGFIKITKRDACILQAVAALLDARHLVIKIIRHRISPDAVKILKLWRSG